MPVEPEDDDARNGQTYDRDEEQDEEDPEETSQAPRRPNA